MTSKKRLYSFIPLLALTLGTAGCQTPPASSQSQTSLSTGSSVQSQPVFGCVADGMEECSSVDHPEDADQNTGFESMTFQEAIEFFKTDQSGLLYFGFPDCPWCAEVVPILKEEARDRVPVHYVRTRDDNRTLLYTPEQKAEIAPYLGSYMGTNKKGEPTLYVPLILVVENGKILDGHEGTVEEHDAHERLMTDHEREEVDHLIDHLVALAETTQASS